jgi:hypothetical protein
MQGFSKLKVNKHAGGTESVLSFLFLIEYFEGDISKC